MGINAAYYRPTLINGIQRLMGPRKNGAIYSFGARLPTRTNSFATTKETRITLRLYAVPVGPPAAGYVTAGVMTIGHRRVAFVKSISGFGSLS